VVHLPSPTHLLTPVASGSPPTLLPGVRVLFLIRSLDYVDDVGACGWICRVSLRPSEEFRIVFLAPDGREIDRNATIKFGRVKVG
jgi:hypothetical protein